MTDSSYKVVYNSNNKRDYQVVKYYLKRGDLNSENSVFSAEDRTAAALKLADDFYLGFPGAVRSTDFSKVKVDSSLKFQPRDGALYHQQLYISAMGYLPREYRDVVRMVCIENKEIKSCDKSSLRRKNIVFHLKQKLIDGLDYLAEFYRRKKIEL